MSRDKVSRLFVLCPSLLAPVGSCGWDGKANVQSDSYSAGFNAVHEVLRVLGYRRSTGLKFFCDRLMLLMF